MMEEEMELEEGEAYCYHNNSDSNVDDKYDDCLDPDVAFSYMDVKIRDVLGHFQRDFEGGVSAENLGAKFGGYGSFLPACPRSPVWSQSRSSLVPSPLEGSRSNGAVAVAVSETQIYGPVPSSTAIVSQGKQRSFDSSKQGKCMPPLRTVEDENSQESVDRKSSSDVADQKMLKVRIKLGSSDNLSIQKKAAIYSGLGLDASPSSSLDGSPSESEGMSCGPTVMDLESPTKILQIMTSCPLNGDQLLSPLQDDLVRFSEKEPLEGWKGENLLDQKISELVDKKDGPMELKGSSSKKSWKKELDVGALACEDLILKTLELPIISGAESNGTSARVQSISHRQKEDLSHSLGKVSEDERGTNFLAPREKNTSSTEGASSRGKKKQKESQLAYPVKESLSGSSSKKSIREDRSVSENGELKSRKVLGKGRDMYRDFFGEIEQEEENRVGTSELDSRNGKDSGSVESDTKLKKRACDNITANVSTLGVHLDAAPHVAPPASVEPIVIKENWVCCDKCEKWRLLPVGKDPKNLPKKWLCSMLDWLPGKNRCSISEIETNTVISQSYALAPTSHSTVGNPDESRLKCTPEVGGKKKNGTKQAIHPSAVGGRSDLEQASKSKKRSYERHSAGGDADTVRLSKKVRNGDTQSANEDRASVGGSASRKLGKNGNSNDQARILKPAYDVPIKQQSVAPSLSKDNNLESLEKGYPNSSKSVMKKGNHDQGSEVPDRDNKEHRKGKKARVSSNNWKESSEKCGSDGTMKSSRKGAEDLRPSLVPISSSCKANKSNGIFPEVKGSPAESVSSSPMRSSKPDVLASAVRNGIDSEEKDKNRGSRFEGEVDKRKASDGEVKPQDNERKRAEDVHKRGRKKDSVGKTCGNEEKSLRRGSSSRVDQNVDEIQIKKSKVLPSSGTSLTEVPHVSTKQASGPSKVNKASKPSEAVIPANETRRLSDRRDSLTQDAANAIKEAKHLKHMADRVKASGSNLEGTGLYFQAALKFLHGASLQESSLNASSKYSDMNQLAQTYRGTAKLCEFCAHEYEKSKDMASAALAYKCMEVAYMKVVYSSQNTVSRDRQELQAALKLVPPGESPSSSASDVDHVNNTAAVDQKAILPKDETLPQAAGNHIITARNRPNLERLLNFAYDVNSAMEASRRSMAAFNAASSKSADAQHKEAMSSVKQAIDFHFQDIDGLLQLVRIATEAINR